MTAPPRPYREPFGLFICCLAIGQALLYSICLLTGESGLGFYLDPRIGLAAIESLLRQGEPFPAISSWSSSIILAAVGWLVLWRRGWLRRYLIVESTLAVPSIIFFGWVLYANMRPAHGFSVAELAFPAMVFIVFTVLPLAWALTLMRSSSR